MDFSFRGQGVARRLVEACMKEARELNVPTLFAWSKDLRGLFESLKWNHLETVEFLGAKVDVLMCQLKEEPIREP